MIFNSRKKEAENYHKNAFDCQEHNKAQYEKDFSKMWDKQDEMRDKLNGLGVQFRYLTTNFVVVDRVVDCVSSIFPGLKALMHVTGKLRCDYQRKDGEICTKDFEYEEVKRLEKEELLEWF